MGRCQKCRHAMSATAKFCTKCGASATSSAPTKTKTRSLSRHAYIRCKSCNAVMRDAKRDLCENCFAKSQAKSKSGTKVKQHSPRAVVAKPPSRKKIHSAKKTALIPTLHAHIRNEHNRFRKLFGAADLQIDSALSAYAQEWADYLATTGKFEHRTTGSYGENLASGCKPEAATQLWFSEIKHYSYKVVGDLMKVGHLTQVISPLSKKLGVGISGKIVVCNYDPHGNMNYSTKSFHENLVSKISSRQFDSIKKEYVS